jgi:formyl-CoA transferase
LIAALVTPHGITGGREERAGNDLTAWALSGWASVFGLQSREPLKGSGRSGSYIAGAAAYGAIVTALYARHRDGLGQVVDVAESEAIGTGFGPYALRAQQTGQTPQRRGDDPFPGPLPVRDGYFVLSLSRDHFWRDAMNVLGLPEYADDPRLNTPQQREQSRDVYSPGVQTKLLEWDRADLLETFGTMRIVGGAVLEPSELADNPHLRERTFFVRPAGAPDAPLSVGAPVRLSATPLELRTPMPEVGADILDQRRSEVRP